MAQNELLQAHAVKMDAMVNNMHHMSAVSEVMDNHGLQANAESHVLKGLLAALIAEISGRSDDPYKELSDILRRMKFVVQEFTSELESEEMIATAKNARDLICDYAETYLRRGEKANAPHQ